MEDWGKQKKMARAVLLSWPNLIGNVVPVRIFTESNIITEHSNFNSIQVLTNWMSCPAKQSRLLFAMLGSHKIAALQFLQM